MTAWFQQRKTFAEILREAASCTSREEAKEKLGAVVSAVSPLDSSAQDALKQAFRLELDSFLRAASSSGVAAIRSPQVKSLLDLAFDSVSAGWIVAQVPLFCLDDLFDSQTAKECSENFAYVENIIDTLKKDFLSKEDLRYIFVKTCNTLMKRLSKCNDLHLCSRILIFLAHSLPLSEKSGVNKKGAFNSDNVTTFDKEDPEISADASEADQATDGSVEKKQHIAKAEDTDSELHVNFGFYTLFWNLQRYLHEPLQCLGDPAAFSTLTKGISETVSVFNKYAFNNTDEASHLKALSNKEFFFTKFLTSPKLMGLQLQDIFFRRHTLVQILLALQCLKDNNASRPASTKLSTAQCDKLTQLAGKVLNALGKVPPHGAEFAANIQKMLAREENWISWKRDGCPPFERVSDIPVTFDEPTATGSKKRRNAVGDTFRKTKSRYTNTADLEVAASDHLPLLAAASAPPTLDHLLELIREDLREPDLPAENRRSRDKSFGWRASRLAIRRRFDVASKDGNFLEYVAAEGDKALMQLVAPAPATPVNASSGAGNANPPPAASSATTETLDRSASAASKAGEDTSNGTADVKMEEKEEGEAE